MSPRRRSHSVRNLKTAIAQGWMPKFGTKKNCKKCKKEFLYYADVNVLGFKLFCNHCGKCDRCCTRKKSECRLLPSASRY